MNIRYPIYEGVYRILTTIKTLNNMALDIKGLKRVFILKKGNDTLTLEDPDSRMSLSEVTDFYSMNYPELTTATLHGPELEEDRAVYRFKTTIGTKG